MKKSSLESINKHLKHATDVAARNKEMHSFTGRRSTKKTGVLTPTPQKPLFDRSGKDQSSESNSSRNSLHRRSKASIATPVIQLHSIGKPGPSSKMLPQSSYTYVSSKNKATVNIFNFNNYNVIRNEKEKFNKEKRPDYSQDHSIKSTDNLQNFFIFSRPNRESVRQPEIKLASSIKGAPKVKVDLSLRNSFKRDDKQLTQNTRVVRHTKSGSMNLGQSNRSVPLVVPLTTVLPQRSFRSGNSVSSVEFTSEMNFKTSRHSSVCEMNDFIKFVQSENRFSKWLHAVKIAHKQRKNMSVTLQTMSQRKSSMSVPITQDPLDRTRDLVCSLISDLKTIDTGLIKTEISPQNQPKAMQAEPFLLVSQEPVITSQNYNALIRETASLFLSQSKRFREGNGDAEHFFRQIAKRHWIDEQSLTVFGKSISILQEHLIFEEALRLLQEKGVVLENIFGYVYEKFGITPGKEAGLESDHVELGGEELSGASFEEVRLSDHISGDVHADIRLDFTQLRDDESEPSRLTESLAN